MPVHTCSSNQSISIHLMLLFIRKIEFIPIGFKHFNTSHVTVYRSTIYINVTIYTDFNTSHVTVYHHKLLPFCPIFSFQYISCYCLSICPVFLDSSFLDFNTSHVTVYLYVVKGFQGDNLEFQYISCYCLSAPSKYGNDKALSFQYISCYCLSELGYEYFLELDEFQYISCYCLSYTRSSPTSSNLISIHLMLLFIRTISSKSVSITPISIHLMLLFIKCQILLQQTIGYFNTSHVTVYPYSPSCCC